jgi:8-oxo-dGTP pyrophosphatase MutT (NUDIX family)
MLTVDPGAQYGSGVSLDEDLAAEGEPEREYNPGIAARLPKKRVAAGMLIRDPQGRVLFVEPVYKPTLDIPGGLSDGNESPAATCLREVTEELGVHRPVGRLLTVDWVPAHGVWSDGLMFVFDGGILTAVEVDAVRATDPELRGVTFLHLAEAQPRLKPSMARRLRTALHAIEFPDRPAYAEFGRSIDLEISHQHD